MKIIIIFFIRIYQKLISPLSPPSCRFYPTCSTYAVQAVIRYGTIRGLLLGIKRILSCHPWALGGYDPIPTEWPGWKRIFCGRRG